MTPKGLFLDHPASLGETYVEHCGHALSFSGEMFVGALACLVHAFVPGLCETTASRAVTGLHHRMTARRDTARTLGGAVAQR